MRTLQVWSKETVATLERRPPMEQKMSLMGMEWSDQTCLVTVEDALFNKPCTSTGSCNPLLMYASESKLQIE